jgi:hypothetical protein
VHQINSSSDLQQRFFGAVAHPNEAALKQAGKQALNSFEAGTPGLRQLRENLQAYASQYGWLPGLDKRRVPVRALHSALNFIVTSSEAIICKRWLVRVYDELCTRFRYGWDGDVVLVLWIHDELVACCRPEIAAEVGAIMVRHAVEPAKHYGFKTPLAAEFKVGSAWAGEPENKNMDTAPMGEGDPPFDPPITENEQDEDGEDEAQSLTQADIDKIDAAIAAGIKANGHAANDGGFAHHSGHSSGSRSDDYSQKHAGKPYTDGHLQGQGYVLAKVFPYQLPDGTKLYEERRYELRPAIAPTTQRPHKACRFSHTVDGAARFDTGPRRIIYNWPAIMRAGPDAIVHIPRAPTNRQRSTPPGFSPLRPLTTSGSRNASAPSRGAI